MTRTRKIPTRVSYVKHNGEADYVDARFDVLLDGTKIGEVTRNCETRGSSAGGARYYTSTWTATVWEFEGGTYPNGRPYRQYVDSNTRVDAVIGYLRQGLGMNYEDARNAAGKRGI